MRLRIGQRQPLGAQTIGWRAMPISADDRHVHAIRCGAYCAAAFGAAPAGATLISNAWKRSGSAAPVIGLAAAAGPASKCTQVPARGRRVSTSISWLSPTDLAAEVRARRISGCRWLARVGVRQRESPPSPATTTKVALMSDCCRPLPRFVV
jgi:hypothetical protein